MTSETLLINSPDSTLARLRRFAGETFVIKYGGNAMVSDDLKSRVAQDIALLRAAGIRPVVVHGAGPQIAAMLERLAIRGTFIQGMRVTDSATLAVVEMVLGGQVNQEVVSLLNRQGVQAVGLTGKDAAFIQAEPLILASGEDLGHVGQVRHIDTTLITHLLDAGRVPVVAPIASDEQGQAYNINADLVAGRLAEALQADRLLLLTNTPGILDGQGQRLARLTPAQVETLIDQGVIQGGMLPKVRGATQAVSRGVGNVHIIDGRVPQGLLQAVLSESESGTLIQAHP